MFCFAPHHIGRDLGGQSKIQNRKSKIVKIGVVSDTHGFFDPRLVELLEGVEVILHGGDVGSLPVLDQLRQIAPVHAVQGNVDSPALGLSPSLIRRFDGVQIEMRHILPVLQSQLEEWARDSVPSKAEAARTRGRGRRRERAALTPEPT